MSEFNIEESIQKLRAERHNYDAKIMGPDYKYGEHDQMADWLEELQELRAEREELKQNILELGDTVLARIFQEQGFQNKEYKQPMKVKK
jgi:uncharacterized coiled-coil DUF342 family protein